MSTLARNALILLFCLVVSVLAITPPESKLRRGKDLAGGSSLIYGVDIKPTDPSDTMSKVVTVVKDRLDPQGVREISVVPQGGDRLEITMPLPSERVKRLRADVEAELDRIGSATVTREAIERAAALPEAQRDAEVSRLSGGNSERQSRIEKAVRESAALRAARAAYADVDARISALNDQLRNAGGEASTDPAAVAIKAQLEPLKAQRDAAIDQAAQAELAYEPSLKAALASGLSAGDVRRALQLSDKPVRKPRKDGTFFDLGSPRQRALKALEEKYPEGKERIPPVLAAWKKYEAERTSLDDPQDIVRILKGAGVLTFRIAPGPGQSREEQDARQQLRAGGPRAVRTTEVRWYRVNNIEQWADTAEDLERLQKDPAGFFMNRALVAEEYKGEYYILLWDTRGFRLADPAVDGQWALANARVGADQLGRPAIDFTMDALGADKLGQLTGNNVGKPMAVLLDDEVYTAPTLQSRISSGGQITGNFDQAQLDYIVRVLSAGSLKAKLSVEPVSITTLGPSLGADNLRKGFTAGMIAFVVTAFFMVAYYFMFGLVAIIALVLNALLIVAAMALNQAAFTLPGIAGIILTFGMAVDANVLVYERIREELNHGHDLKSSVRTGYARALSAIVDGNVTTLIVCVVLGFFGTAEIKGFGLTLGIGTVTTLFAQLFATRFIFALLLDKMNWRRARMLPMVVPAVQRVFTQNIDWLGLRFVAFGVSLVFTLVGLGFIVFEGRNLLGTEFRGGTSVTMVLRHDRAPDGTPGAQVKMKRAEVAERVRQVAEAAPAGNPLRSLDSAEVIAVNPDRDNVTSGTFTIRTLVTDQKLVQEALSTKFRDVLDVREPLRFAGSDGPADRAQVFPVAGRTLAEVVERPGAPGTVSEYEGGAAFLLENIAPPVPLADLQSRLAAARSKGDFADVSARPWEVRVVGGTEAAVTSAAVLVKAPDVSYAADPRAWASDVRDREWGLIHAALAQGQTLDEVQSFSPAVAESFRNRAITAVLLSTILIVIYVWVRFNSFRYSLAAILTTLHDCFVAVGFVAMATTLYRVAPDVAAAMGLLPFKIDLNVVAAVLTILGYSLNDTVVVMDRIRENRGKLKYASRRVINDAINQTLSRTVITASTTFFCSVVLYLVGGEGVRVFAFTMIIGIVIGTYSSIAVAAPLVWVRKADKSVPKEPADAGLARTAA